MKALGFSVGLTCATVKVSRRTEANSSKCPVKHTFSYKTAQIVGWDY